MITKHQDAAQAGSPFPDWGYSCEGMHDESEDAHWQPFINHFAKMIQSKYPQSWTEEQEKTVTFLFGIVSHYMADIVWHGLADVDKGFIDVTAALNFHYVYSEAHSHDDPGGDVMTVNENDYGYLTYKWYVPFNDIMQVYHETGRTNVTMDRLYKCTMLLYTGTIAERLINELFLIFAKKSPFLVEQFQDYHVGGLDDMGIRTSWEWEQLVQTLESSHNFTFPVNIEEGEEKSTHLPPSQAKIAMMKYVQEKLQPTMTMTEQGAIFSLKNDPPKRIEEIQESVNAANSMTAKEFFTADKEYAYTGYGLAKMKLDDNKTALIVGSHGVGVSGAPQLGAVNIVEDGNSKFSLIGKERYLRTGWAVASVDINQDGLVDLVVSTPTTDLRPHQFWAKGEVHIYLAQGKTGVYSSDQPDIIISTHSNGTVHMGDSFTVSDVNDDGFDDLIINSPLTNVTGNPQTGIVSVFLSNKKYSLRQTIDLSAADLTLRGESKYSTFGQHSLVIRDKQQRILLLVGAPTYAVINKTQSSGKLYAYQITKQKDGISAKIIFSISGTQEFERFGFSFDYGKPYSFYDSLLAVSALTYSVNEWVFQHYQSGAVYLIDISGLSGDYTMDNIKDRIRARIYGNQAYSRFGFVVGFADINKDGLDDLYVTEPYRNTEAGRVAGAIYVWLGGKQFPTGPVYEPYQSASKMHMYQTRFAKFGYSVLVGDFDADGELEFAVSAPRHTKDKILQGMVVLVK
jgi:glycosylphosphatidylinositol phospholipase D